MPEQAKAFVASSQLVTKETHLQVAKISSPGIAATLANRSIIARWFNATIVTTGITLRVLVLPKKSKKIVGAAHRVKNQNNKAR